MTKLPNQLTRTAAAAAFVLSAVAAGSFGAVALNATAANAQPWPHTENRCTNDACATFRCDGHDCTRISDWRSRDVDRPYYYTRDYDDGFGMTQERCESNTDRCATFRCDSDGANCTRIGDWHYRY